MNFENNPGVKQEEKEVVAELAEEGMAKAEKMEGDKLDANVEAAKKSDEAVANENLSQVREGMKQEVAEAKTEGKSAYSPEDTAAINAMFDSITTKLSKIVNGEGLMNKLVHGAQDKKVSAMYLDRIKSFQESVNKGENIGDIGTILDHVPFVSEIKGKNDELIQKFSRKDKKYVANTHIFGQGA